MLRTRGDNCSLQAATTSGRSGTHTRLSNSHCKAGNQALPLEQTDRRFPQQVLDAVGRLSGDLEPAAGYGGSEDRRGLALGVRRRRRCTRCQFVSRQIGRSGFHRSILWKLLQASRSCLATWNVICYVNQVETDNVEFRRLKGLRRRFDVQNRTVYIRSF